MNNEMYYDYIERLRRGLKGLPPTRQQEIIADIQNHFTEGLADGVSEHELCEMLGTPETLANEYTAIFAAEEASQNPTPRTVMRAIWAGLGVAFLNLFLGAWMWLILACIWMAFALTAVACVVSGPLAAVLAALKPLIPALPVYVDYPLIYIFAGVAVTALGILIAMLSLWSGKWLIRGVVAYVKFNVDVVTGRRNRK